MKPSQRVVLFCGIVAIVIIAIYPPWAVTYYPNGWDAELVYHAHSFAFRPPAAPGAKALGLPYFRLKWDAAIDSQRLLIELGLITLFSTGLAMALEK